MSRKRRGRGEGAIFQRADGLWASSLSLGHDKGKRVRKTVYGQTKAEVQKKLRDLQTDHALGRLTDTEKFNVGDYLTLWLENTARVKVDATTSDRYKLVVEKQIKPHLASILLNKLTGFHIGQLYAVLEKSGDSVRARQMAGTVLYGALKQAVKMKLLLHNPCDDASGPKATKKEMQIYDNFQVQDFLGAAEQDRLYAMYVLAVDSGMRPGELFGLPWPDIDFDAGSVQVQRTLEVLRGGLRLKPPKTEAGHRRIDLSPFTLDALHEHRKRMLAEGKDVKTGLVFLRRKGRLPSKVKRQSPFLPIHHETSRIATHTVSRSAPLCRIPDYADSGRR